MIKRAGILLLLAVCAACHNAPERGARRDGRGAPPSGAEWMTRLDQDGDSKISRAEFDGPAEHFNQFDKNGDGFLTQDEVPSGPPEGGGPRR